MDQNLVDVSISMEAAGKVTVAPEPPKPPPIELDANRNDFI